MTAWCIFVEVLLEVDAEVDELEAIRADVTQRIEQAVHVRPRTTTITAEALRASWQSAPAVDERRLARRTASRIPRPT